MTPEEVVRVFKALGNENRLKILEAIHRSQGKFDCGPESVRDVDVKDVVACCVDEIVGKFEMAQSTISQNLKELYNAGLLERHKRAQWVYYTINRDKVEELREYLHRFAGGDGSGSGQ